MGTAMPSLRLGIDVGGTNTDAVLMDGRDVIASAKCFTTADVRSGVMEAVTRIFDAAGDQRARVSAIMIGTTQFLNAFVQRTNLEPVAIIRIALPKGDGVPPLAGWPPEVAKRVCGHVSMIRGGSHFTGEDYAPLDEEALHAAALDAQSRGLQTVAITSSFAPIRPDLETRAAAIFRRVMPDAHITLSHQVGGLGLIDRESAAIINATLAGLARAIVASLVQAFHELAVDAPVFISQNDGTLISTERAAAFPIFTCSAGPTNSIRGAAFLTGLDEAVVADIGGTTTDIGFLTQGFPRETNMPTLVGGVRTNFRMPDVLSIGLGGGSVVRLIDGHWRIGPDSVGYRLQTEARIFGGATLTATDIAVAAGQSAIGDPSRVHGLEASTVASALDNIHQLLEVAIDQMKTSETALPLILVGGGAMLVSRPISGTSQVLRPDHADVANAVGAAIARVSGRVDKLYDVATLGRDAALDQAKADASAAAIEAGADPASVEIIDITELPMTHMKAGMTQIKVRAVGDLTGFLGAQASKSGTSP